MFEILSFPTSTPEYPTRVLEPRSPAACQATPEATPQGAAAHGASLQQGLRPRVQFLPPPAKAVRSALLGVPSQEP